MLYASHACVHKCFPVISHHLQICVPECQLFLHFLQRSHQGQTHAVSVVGEVHSPSASYYFTCISYQSLWFGISTNFFLSQH